jgi:hypothetical protein
MIKYFQKSWLMSHTLLRQQLAAILVGFCFNTHAATEAMYIRKFQWTEIAVQG